MAKKLLLSALAAVAALSGFWYFAKDTNAGCVRVFSPKLAAEPYYHGPLFDAHLHLPVKVKIVSEVSVGTGNSIPFWTKDLSLNYLSCLFEREGIYNAYGFHLFTKYFPDAEVEIAKKMDKRYPGTITHFIMPTIINDSINPSIAQVAKALDDNPGLFRGIGELKMYDGKEPDDPYLIGFIELAKKHNLIVMMHPFDHHKSGVEKIVRQYPEVDFLLHGIVEDVGPAGVKNNLNWLDKLIAKHSNVYYSIDAGLQIYGWQKSHYGRMLSKEEILPYLTAHFAEQLQTDLAYYKNIIEKYPDRFLRGTDRSHASHYDQEISALLEEYSRALIGRLAPSVQEKFAHANADALLKK